ncbi:hypothetical protein BMF89_00155 [Arthrobacter sp. SRS-W-1-2016]|uniref:hypothetical protein n=1 Tax=Arthrobacter sp. SRS-W-1-2016 TaxID=1930254 RepID=UPI000990B929|nr:hypothetical protein [Arthrobacter sp. SRS-W-1-2016]OOP65298.1 hypothetical protein BMF89_00155 [Arthrobacter sp. SRS-W-1-2016]
MARPALRTDIASAVRRSGGATRGCGRELRALEARLEPDEKVQIVAGVRYGKKLGLVALTGRRLMFLMEGWFTKAFVEFPIARISQVGWYTGYGVGELILNVDGLREEIASVSTGVGGRMAAELRDRVARIDSQRLADLERSAALFAMVEQLHSLHFAPGSPEEEVIPDAPFYNLRDEVLTGP